MTITSVASILNSGVHGYASFLFNLDRRLFVSANFTHNATVKTENAEVTIPLTVEYKLMSAEDITNAEREAADAATMAAARAELAGKFEKQIAKLYHINATVPPTGRTITPEMRLPKALIIQNKWPYLR